MDQWPTVEELIRAEDEIVLPGLTERTAYELGCHAVDAGLQQGLPIAIGVWRGERQLFHCALPGSTQDNNEWLRRKGRVVMRFERSSLYVARLCKDQGTTLAEKFALPTSRFAAAGGAVPLRVRGAGVVGWMGVSGLPQLADHQFVMATLRDHLAAGSPGPTG
ncbi:heme-degrading domain-containing protein [Arthrobacter sp. NEB 688]|uniref:heme-degrading domain-containing protein n=1 Tax=Arthrobacter sp. NEB 688 TaxID=904039 RepID=UPI001565F925|nr:heme-degrading domain-containing protein [Arthrobacter sp. NEB 688]QKE82651.1 heme-degrading domain-containing protein [Arthrobacter sp. NEB 688]